MIPSAETRRSPRAALTAGGSATPEQEVRRERLYPTNAHTVCSVSGEEAKLRLRAIAVWAQHAVDDDCTIDEAVEAVEKLASAIRRGMA